MVVRGFSEKLGHSDSFKINIDLFKTFRGIIFYKKIPGLQLVLEAQYIINDCVVKKCLKSLKSLINYNENNNFETEQFMM